MDLWWFMVLLFLWYGFYKDLWGTKIGLKMKGNW